jgi:hypothetical protein
MVVSFPYRALNKAPGIERISPVEDFTFPFLEYYSDMVNTGLLEIKDKSNKQ